MQKIMARLSNVRLHYILILAFVLTAAITIVISEPMTMVMAAVRTKARMRM